MLQPISTQCVRSYEIIYGTLLVINCKWASKPLQLLYKAPLLIPSRMNGHELGRCWVVSMKYKHVIFHPVNLRKGDLIISQLQERRDVKKVIGRLVDSQ
jgi:hypothetical protein